MRYPGRAKKLSQHDIVRKKLDEIVKAAGTDESKTLLTASSASSPVAMSQEK